MGSDQQQFTTTSSITDLKYVNPDKHLKLTLNHLPKKISFLGQIVKVYLGMQHSGVEVLLKSKFERLCLTILHQIDIKELETVLDMKITFERHQPTICMQ